MILEEIRIINFVRFKDVRLKFEKRGIYFLLGGSGVGKTSVFEALRNCLKTTDIERPSTKHDERRPSMIICRFRDIEKMSTNKVDLVYFYQAQKLTHKSRTTYKMRQKLEDDAETVTNADQSEVEEQAVSSEQGGNVKVNDECKGVKNMRINKMQERENNKVAEGTDEDKESDRETMGTTVDNQQKMEEDRPTFMVKIFIDYNNCLSCAVRSYDRCKTWQPSDISRTRFEIFPISENVTEIERKITEIDQILGYNTATTDVSFFDDLIRDTINIQFMLPHRGISYTQSAEANASNFITSSKNANVLLQYCQVACSRSTEDEMLNCQEKECQRSRLEKKYFTQISNEVKHKVYMEEDGEILMDHGLFEGKIPVLRMPEAMVGAKILSILMSSQKTNILCIEEPQRGMDTQITANLKDFLQSKHEEFTLAGGHSGKLELIIVATHDPTFFTHWSVKNSYFFQEARHECQIHEGDGLIQALEKNEKNLRHLTSYPLNCVPFSKKILFVEGPSDLLLCQAIQRILSNRLDITQTILSKLGLKVKAPKLMNVLSSLSIVAMGSKSYVPKVETMCKFLRLNLSHKRFYLLDSDARHCNDILTALNMNEVNTSLADISEMGVFIWEKDLENGIIDFCDRKNCIDILVQNNVPTVRVNNEYRIAIANENANEKKKQKSTKGKGRPADKQGKLFLESTLITEANIRNVVEKCLKNLNKSDFDRKDNYVGTFPNLIDFLIRCIV